MLQMICEIMQHFCRRCAKTLSESTNCFLISNQFCWKKNVFSKKYNIKSFLTWLIKLKFSWTCSFTLKCINKKLTVIIFFVCMIFFKWICNHNQYINTSIWYNTCFYWPGLKHNTLFHAICNGAMGSLALKTWTVCPGELSLQYM